MGASLTVSDPTVALNRAIRDALRANFQLSSYVLWHNAVPATANRSTRGPALAGLRASAAQRRLAGIRIKPIAGRLRIVSTSIDQSFATATATTVASGRVRLYQRGEAQARATALHERARVELHRLGRSARFVVWRVTLAK